MNKDIINIIKNYLLPSKINIVINKSKCHTQLLNKTHSIKNDLNIDRKLKFYKHVSIDPFDTWLLSRY